VITMMWAVWCIGGPSRFGRKFSSTPVFSVANIYVCSGAEGCAYSRFRSRRKST